MGRLGIVRNSTSGIIGTVVLLNGIVVRCAVRHCATGAIVVPLLSVIGTVQNSHTAANNRRKLHHSSPAELLGIKRSVPFTLISSEGVPLSVTSWKISPVIRSVKLR